MRVSRSGRKDLWILNWESVTFDSQMLCTYRLSPNLLRGGDFNRADFVKIIAE